MKKYLKLLYVAVFAAMSFGLTACGNDDDNPEGENNATSTITINGKGYKTHPYGGAASVITDYGTERLGSYIEAELYPAGSDESDLFPHVGIYLYTGPGKPKKGTTLDINDQNVAYVTGIMEVTNYDEYKSGKVTVADVKGSTVTLSFDNFKVTNDDNQTMTINGTLPYEYRNIDDY